MTASQGFQRTGWSADVQAAVAQLTAATGLQLVSAGTFATTSSIPAGTDITISWVPSLSGGDTVGLTTFYYINSPAYTPQMVGANIQVLQTVRAGAGQNGELPILLHELGHAVGLGHTPGQPEIMNPYVQPDSTYQPGDLNGLRAVGSGGGCSGFYK